jgi:CheY-like chemotaxis protein
MARVGLLEDNSRIAKLCATMLNYAGHDVTVYTNAFECLDALAVLDIALWQAPSLPIDVLILDLHLPVLPGLEVLRILRASTRTSALPLIFCTAATHMEIDQAFTLAPDAILVEKPFKLQSLVSAISSSLLLPPPTDIPPAPFIAR